jgi:hypothetical protein
MWNDRYGKMCITFIVLQKVAREEFDSTHLPTFLTKMTALLKSNNDGKGFFVGEKVRNRDNKPAIRTEWSFCGITSVKDKLQHVSMFFSEYFAPESLDVFFREEVAYLAQRFPLHFPFISSTIHFLSFQMSYADISIFTLGNILCSMAENALDKFPELKGHYQRVGENPGIKEWVKNRPQTKM